MRILKDNDIREVLLKELHCKYSNEKDTKIVNEMGVLHGQSRVDVAVINGILHGYEIKSESDNLRRLPSQIKDYNLVFDRMTIVVQHKYLQEVRTMIPQWWGILLVTRRGEKINIREVRKGKVNPKVDSFALSHLLWRDEALELLRERGLHKGYLSKPKKVIYTRLSQSVEVNELREYVSKQLRSREQWLSD